MTSNSTKTTVQVLPLAAISLLTAGCGGGGTPVDRAIALPTAASGYATAESDLRNPDETVIRTARLQSYNASTGAFEQKTFVISFSPTGVVDDEFLLTFDGIPFTLQWNPDNGRYEGTNAGAEVHSYPWMITENAQATLGWITAFADPGGHGVEVGGFNTAPDVVNARRDLSDTAQFTGFGGLSVIAADDSFWAALMGEAVLTVNFGNREITGTIDLSQDNGYGGYAVPDTVLTLNDVKITQNTFEGTAGIDGPAFGLSNVGTISVDGMFYEAEATAVGGNISGTGTATAENGGGLVLLNGAFLADE